ncbi:transposase [Pseudoroseomonas wenyumeiae]
MADQLGFFDVDERYAALSAAGDPLERLSVVVDFEIFRRVLDAALKRSDPGRGGRPPYDAVMMFRILELQAVYSLSTSRGTSCPSFALQASGCTSGAGRQDGLALP